MWRVYLLSGLIACVAGTVTAFITVQVTAPAAPHTRTVTLEGEESLEPPNEKVVYYKTPFESPPYITTPSGFDPSYQITDQKAESFKLTRVLPATVGARLKWKAEGQPAK